MSVVPPTLSLTVSIPRRACVLDASLALSRHGLLAARRLSTEFDLWLAREFWEILDNSQFYVARPDLLVAADRGSPSGARGLIAQKELSKVLQQWELARTEKDLAGLKLHWIADSPGDSLLPDGVAPTIVDRFEILASALDGRAKHDPEASRGGERVVSDCFRDSAALTAALIPYRGFILSCLDPPLAGAPLEEPPICHFLQNLDLPCARIEPADPAIQVERALLAPVLARAGISELMWAGLRLAAVHLVIPGALLVPPRASVDEGFPADFWEGAKAYWYTLP